MSRLSSVKILEDEGRVSDPSLRFWLKAYKHDGTVFQSDEVPGHTCTNSGSLFQYGRGRKLDKVDDYIRVTTSPRITDIKPVTYIVWATPTTLGEVDSGFFIHKGTITGGDYGPALAANNVFNLIRNYSVSSIYRNSANNTVVLGQRQMFVAMWDGTTDASNIRLYRATVTSPPVECAYGTENDGVGNFVTDSGYDMYLGNNQGTTKTFDGLQHEYIIYNALLTPQRLNEVWRGTKGQSV